MVYNLVYLTLRRNISFSCKTWQHADYILQRRLPSIIASNVSYSSDSSKEQKIEKKQQPVLTDGKSYVDHLISQISKGKISGNDFSNLAKKVLLEGQYKKYTEAPQPVQVIGMAGLVPMLGIPLLTLLNGHAMPGLVFAHLAYGATVLSFLGGSKWHYAINKNELSYEKLGWCIAPQVIGWSSLMLPVPVGMLMMTFGFCMSIVHDVLLTSYPQWLKSLRLVLTMGTVLSFLLMFIFNLIM